MVIKGIVFDLDATLVNIGGFIDWKKAYAKIIDKYLESGCSEEMVQRCSEKGLFGMLDEMYVELQKEYTKGLKIQEQAYRILSDYEISGSNKCELMPGCLETLNWIKEKELPLGICTSNSQEVAEITIRNLDLFDYFDSIVGRSIKHKMKPNPDQLLECFKQMRVEPKEGIMVGDSHKDIIAGKSIGAYTIAIPVHFSRIEKIKEANVDKIINNLSELPAVIESLI